mmetsp:Transcript_33277/g.56570  ORF Transcript_33277/g.56570 Transcript_33277/m.56570 type:complete len:197 (+) Transcript_33277:143-733(+)|eukprot:CAMPEP_0184443502 /NCGR_PEP_ID=MMETSP0740-20130409/452_1 /TAXON_ID=385413 /ORGANISM="Thalassiosira miniscula, Strain CCMP1093" /LENGTH=196 /DNA_ID=CAMNT_0026811749 /DNA_START=138 /DNA_END=728 /DNA_ORIENTATION=-
MKAVSIAIIISTIGTHAAHAFVAPACGRVSTAIHLEDHIADMIDGEVIRLQHKEEAEALFALKQRQWNKLNPTIPTGFDFDIDAGIFDAPPELDIDAGVFHVPPTELVAGEEEGVLGFSSGVDRSKLSGPRRKKDERMASDDPRRYCADRCVSTGNCDVFEDMFEMGPSEVMEFCTDCVLSEDEEPCDVPESFLRP